MKRAGLAGYTSKLFKGGARGGSAVELEHN